MAEMPTVDILVILFKIEDIGGIVPVLNTLKAALPLAS